MLAGRGARKGAGAERGVAGAFGGEPAVAGKTPGAVREDAHADALALGIGQALDAAVLRRDELVAFHHDTRVGVLGAGRGGRVNGGCT